MRAGDRRALARLLSFVEARDQKSFELLSEIWPLTGKAKSIGITGPAGGGKSTLIDQLILYYRQKGLKVGVIAVDPTSPFSGGAVLGDRVRMQRHSSDPDVFIRSVGSRGKSGGISFSTRALMQLLDAFGADIILVETVGAGQSEVDVADIVDTTVVILVPEGGDSIQTLKAGILEIADIFVVNKKDRDGADRVASDVEAMLSLKPGDGSWRPPVLLAEAQSGEGIRELGEAIVRHQNELEKKGLPEEEKERRRLHELSEIVEARLASEILEKLRGDSKAMKELMDSKRPNLYEMAERLLSSPRR